MKKAVKIIAGVLIFLALVLSSVYLFLLTQKPQYSGSLELKGLKGTVDIFFDEFGIPHIYGQNEEDVYFAFGYVHAQDRLFQMEMMRRVSAGRLSEVFGSSMIPIDKFFRMLGIREHAGKSAKQFLNDDKEPYRKAALSYLAGINAYIEKGKTPVEFMITGIPKEKYTATDIFLVADYMSFVFQMAFKTDPLMSRIEKKCGEKYLADLSCGYVPGSENVMLGNDSTGISADFSFSFQNNIEGKLPVPLWLGSNSWAVAPKKSKSGRALFANDTHIGYSQPAAWYEADLEYPGFSFYGNFLGGFPFAPIGHTPCLAWGMTIAENDDLDFFREKTDTLHPDRVWYIDHWENLQSRIEVIKVKDSLDVKLVVRSSHHGPVCTDVIGDFKEVTGDPVTASWTFLKFANNFLQVMYDLDHAQKMEDVRKAASEITAPGLNIVYSDSTGNIAWWLAAKLVKRPAHVNSCVLLDGSTGKDEWLGWYDFESNPHSENPSSGFVCSSNNNALVEGKLYPGYYTPEDRFLRIGEALGENKKFDRQQMQALQLDAVSVSEAGIAKKILAVIGEGEKNKSANHKKAAEVLAAWNGDHGISDVAPVIYYKLLYHILSSAMEDELGEKGFNQFLLTHVEKNSIAPLFQNDSSAWWDNINTKDSLETRKQIFEKSFDQTVSELERQLGKNPGEWKWGRVHLLEYVHPIGKKKPLDKFFNVGPFPMAGGNETINQQGFDLAKDGVYKIKFGPALRRVIDFADPENGKSISPTGQSGNVMSRHYDDQAKLFVKGKVRKEMMNREEIEKKCKDKLTLRPIQH